jgi:diacylglycerol kinase
LKSSPIADLNGRNDEPLKEAPPPPEKVKNPIPRNTFLRSFVFAFAGIVHVIRTQRNMRVHLGLGLAAATLALLLGLGPTEWAVLLVTMALVYCLEMLNTVVEAIVDLVTDEYHDLAKVAKDVAAGAVLVAAIFAVLVGLCLFAPRLLNIIFHL